MTRWMTSAALAAMGMALAPAEVAAQEENPFTGFYIGVQLGRESIIAGANVGGIDTLEQEDKLSGDFFAGVRWRVGDRFVIGAEGAVGVEDGNLKLKDPANNLSIEYENATHWRVGAIAGVVLGEAQDTLVYAYLSETRRGFRVQIDQGAVSTRQRDEQGLLRYGVGVERLFGPEWSARASIGSGRAEFDGPANIDPEPPLDVSVGLIRRF